MDLLKRSKQPRWRLVVVPLVLTELAICISSQAAEWPQWRGPDGNGVGQGSNLPSEWGPQKNIAWHRELPSWSGSSPIVWGDRVFVISPSKSKESHTQNGSGQGHKSGKHRRENQSRGGNGKMRTLGPGGSKILLFCLSRQDGSVLWQHDLDEGNQLHRKHNSSSPSPVTDGRYIWATTGNGVVVALDMNGHEQWRIDLQREYGKFGMSFGYASSPLLYDDKLIFQVLHGYRTDESSYLVAFEAQTGVELWRCERSTDARSESADAYTTPSLLVHQGGNQIVILGGDYVTGHDPHTGIELWRSSGLNPRQAGNYRIVPSPISVDGMIYAPSRKNPLLALRAGGSGDVTHSHLVWRWDRDGAPDVPTPACDGQYFYMVDDQGQITCLDAKTGSIVWGPQDTGIGRVSASPVLADGKVFIVSEMGETAVVQSGRVFKLIAINQLDGGWTLSTPAVVGNRLFIRTGNSIYCIGHPEICK